MPEVSPSIQIARPNAKLKPLGEFFDMPQLPLRMPLTLLGSGPTVHVRLRSSTVDRVHALILNLDDRLLIRDLGSHTYVVVNGRAVRESPLREGDLIGIGRITFELLAAAPSP